MGEEVTPVENISILCW